MFTRLSVLTAALGLIAAQEPSESDKVRAALHKAVNELRTAAKVVPLTRNAKLDAAAQKHAENMAKQDKLADDLKKPHVLDGKGPKDRVVAEGYAAATGAENIACIDTGGPNSKGEELAAKVVKIWVDSPLHYKNIASETFTETGIGAALSKSGTWYYCQVFAAPRKK